MHVSVHNNNQIFILGRLYLKSDILGLPEDTLQFLVQNLSSGYYYFIYAYK